MIDCKEHVYFLVHKAHQCFKVGRSTHPLRRWAQIQAHDQTDFGESLVFDVASDVDPRRIERTLQQSIADYRLEMPGSVEGHTEWFDYQALDSVRRFAAKHGKDLGIGDGYSLAKPSPPRNRPFGERWLGAPSGWKAGARDYASMWNNEVAAAIEKWTDGIVASDSLIGTVLDDLTLHLFFRRELTSVKDVSIHPYDSLISVGDTASDGGFLRRTWIGGSLRDDGTFIRLALSDLFPALGRLTGTGSWAETTPGVERVWAALGRLVASAPPLAAPPLGFATDWPCLYPPPREADPIFDVGALRQD